MDIDSFRIFSVSAFRGTTILMSIISSVNGPLLYLAYIWLVSKCLSMHLPGLRAAWTVVTQLVTELEHKQEEFASALKSLYKYTHLKTGSSKGLENPCVYLTLKFRVLPTRARVI